ncbi:MAG: hypothetical protein AABY22_36610 [Nanoarchaeota archaeon]
MQINYKKGWGFVISTTKKEELDELERLAKENKGHVHFTYKGRWKQGNGSYAMQFHHTLVKFKRNGTFLTSDKPKKNKKRK